MIKILVTLCLTSIALSEAGSTTYPWGYINIKTPNCKTVTETVQTELCGTTYKQDCKKVPTTQTKIEFEEACKDVPDKECKQVLKDVTNKACVTKLDEKCVDVDQVVYDVTFKDDCKDVETKICTEIAYAQIAPVLPIYGGYGGHYLKKRSDKAAAAPAVATPKCETKVDKVCTKIPVQNSKTIKVPKCTVTPKEECKDVTTKVANLECKDVTRKLCSQVPKETKVEVSIEQCSAIPQTNCQKIPQQINKQVCN
jgi:hypothetical protein